MGVTSECSVGKDNPPISEDVARTCAAAAESSHVWMVANFLVPFDCTYAELGQKTGVVKMWADHVERSSAPQSPRQRWRDEAAAALAWLQSPELAGEQVRFICEVKMMLEATFSVHALVRQLNKALRAVYDEHSLPLHEGMLAETAKTEAAEQLAADGSTALMLAVRDGAGAAEVAPLLEASPPAEADAALVVACAYAREDLVAALPALAQGAARVWHEAWRRGASNDAAQEMGAATAAALVGAAADVAGGVDARDESGDWTALQRAAAGGHDQAVGALLLAGADMLLLATHKFGKTPLYLAAENGHEAVVARLVRGGGGRGRAAVDHSTDTRTPLAIAAENGHDAVVQVLLESGAAVDGDVGTWLPSVTALHIAAEEGHDAVVRTLLDGGAAVDGADTHGQTPLYGAALYGHDAVVRMLLDDGAVVNAARDDGRTPLHAAASHGASSPRGALGIKLPRTRAGGHEATVQLLLDRGAAVNQVNDRGDTPLAIAELWGNEASATRIRAAGGRVVTPSWWQCC